MVVKVVIGVVTDITNLKDFMDKLDEMGAIRTTGVSWECECFAGSRDFERGNRRVEVMPDKIEERPRFNRLRRDG